MKTEFDNTYLAQLRKERATDNLIKELNKFVGKSVNFEAKALENDYNVATKFEVEWFKVPSKGILPKAIQSYYSFNRSAWVVDIEVEVCPNDCAYTFCGDGKMYRNKVYLSFTYNEKIGDFEVVVPFIIND